MQIEPDTMSRAIKERYNLQTIDFGYSLLLPDTVYNSYSTNVDKQEETLLYTSDLNQLERAKFWQKGNYYEPD